MFNFNFGNFGIKNTFRRLSPETVESLDHDLCRLGYSIDSIENAFVYLSNTTDLNKALLEYSESINSCEKNYSFSRILDLLK